MTDCCTSVYTEACHEISYKFGHFVKKILATSKPLKIDKNPTNNSPSKFEYATASECIQMQYQFNPVNFENRKRYSFIDKNKIV